jgi:hypothetical protein
MDTTVHLYEGPTVQDRPKSLETVYHGPDVFINQKWSKNHEIILKLDANEALGEESRGIAKLMRECNLVDLHDIPEMEWNSNSKTPTNKETSDRLISCLAHHGYKHAYNDEEHWSTMMVLCQTNVGCMLIWMQCQYLEVLPMIKAASSRGFTSKNEKKTKKYLDELDKDFLDHKIDSRIDLLMEDAPHITRNQLKCQYKGIDNDISHGMLASEHKVRHLSCEVR